MIGSAGYIQLLMSEGHLFPFDSDTDSDPDTRSTDYLSSSSFFQQGGPVNPHFSQAFYCGGSGRAYGVALLRAPRRTVEYAGPSVTRLVSTPVCAASLRNLVRNAG